MSDSLRLDIVRGLLLDLDGTVYQDRRAVPGAVEALEVLRERGIPHRFVTNTTRLSRDGLVDLLGSLGIPAERHEIFTAPLAALRWLRSREVRRVALLVPEEGRPEFADLEVDDTDPEAVVVGDLGDGWTFEVMNRALSSLLGGARLVALQRNRYWRRGDELVLDAGPFVQALEFAAGVEAVVVGKPEPGFFQAASGSMGLEPGEVAVVGDDIGADVGRAQGAGALGILVRTGKHRPDDQARSGIEPDLVIDSVADLPRLLST